MSKRGKDFQRAAAIAVGRGQGRSQAPRQIAGAKKDDAASGAVRHWLTIRHIRRRVR